MKTLEVEGFTCKIGQNAQENWNILDKALQRHWFFHLSSFPSCYVIWENEDDSPAMDSLKVVARLCVDNTKHKARNVKVDCTRCKNVIKGENIGELYYSSKRKVMVLRA